MTGTEAGGLLCPVQAVARPTRHPRSSAISEAWRSALRRLHISADRSMWMTRERRLPCGRLTLTTGSEHGRRDGRGRTRAPDTPCCRPDTPSRSRCASTRQPKRASRADARVGRFFRTFDATQPHAAILLAPPSPGCCDSSRSRGCATPAAAATIPALSSRQSVSHLLASLRASRAPSVVASRGGDRPR